MPGGTVELSVPLIGGVIQIGAGGELEAGKIRVSKNADSVTVRQVDGRPLQVEIVCETGKLTVFHEPVAVLSLTRVIEAMGQSAWCAERHVHVTHGDRLKEFAEVIATFGTAKRRKDATTSPPVAVRGVGGTRG
jgi:hypothetical protein